MVQPSHRRGRSLSEALTLERSEDGALVVSSEVANQGLTAGKPFTSKIDFDIFKS